MKKIKQIFKKIGQTKALDLYMCSREFLLCCCSYLNDESEKQTHLCRTIGQSDQRSAGLTGCRIIAMLPFYCAYSALSKSPKQQQELSWS